MTTEALKKLAEHGFMFREQFIDGDPDLGLNGVRLTNVAKLWEPTYSIQIFDRQTCSLSQGGFTNDEHVSLTKHDGAEFLSWLRMAHPEVLSEEVWNKLPEGPAFRDTAGGINGPKMKLIQTCAEFLPQWFGPGSLGAEPGANFYEVLSSAIADHGQLNEVFTVRTIVFLERRAHASYHAANNALLRASIEKAETSVKFAQAAYVHIGTAECMIAEAAALREDLPSGTLAQIPAAHFPEAIPLDEAAKLFEGSPATPQEPEGSSVTPQEAPALTVGLIVTVSDPDSPFYRQIGEIIKIAPNAHFGTFYYVALKTSSIDRGFTAAQLKPIA